MCVYSWSLRQELRGYKEHLVDGVKHSINEFISGLAGIYWGSKTLWGLLSLLLCLGKNFI